MFDNMFDWFWEFLYRIAFWINQLLDGVFKIFLFFSGSAPDSVNVEFTGRADGNILKLIFDDSTIPFWLAGFTILAGAVFLISLAFGMFRTEFAEDSGKQKGKVAKATFKGIMTLVLIPAIFGIGIMATTTLLSGLVEAMAGETYEGYSFAQQIFDVCVPENSWQHGALKWDKPIGEMDDIISFKQYNYVIQYIGGILILFVIGVSAINVMGRLIDIVLLYIISPFVIAVTPLDEGNRLGIWKDLVISKFLSIAGIILCYYIFFQCMNIINDVLVGDSFIIKLSKLLFAIAGALASNKGSHIITNLVGHNTALLEGQQQQLAVSTLGHGAMLGVSTAFKLGKGAWKAGRATAGRVGTAGMETLQSIKDNPYGFLPGSGSSSGRNTSVNTTNSMQSRAEGYSANGSGGSGGTNNNTTGNNLPFSEFGNNNQNNSNSNQNTSQTMQNGQGFNNQQNNGANGTQETPMPDSNGGVAGQTQNGNTMSNDGGGVIKDTLDKGQSFNDKGNSDNGGEKK